MQRVSSIDMSRSRIVMPCVVFAFVMGAAASSVAAAAQPEFLECAKLKTYIGAYSSSSCTEVDAKHKGKYELREANFHECITAAKVGRKYTGLYDNKICTEEDPKHAGKYERAEDVGRGKAFEGKSYGAELHELYYFEEQIRCKGGARDKGLITSATTLADVTLSLRDCTLPFEGYARCSSEGHVDEIVTVPLSGKLGYVDAASHEVGVDLAPETPEAGETVAIFDCDYGFRLGGSIVMSVTGDVNAASEHFNLEHAGSERSVGLESLEGGSRDVLEIEPEDGPLSPVALTVHFTNDYANKDEDLELRA